MIVGFPRNDQNLQDCLFLIHNVEEKDLWAPTKSHPVTEKRIFSWDIGNSDSSFHILSISVNARRTVPVNFVTSFRVHGFRAYLDSALFAFCAAKPGLFV